MRFGTLVGTVLCHSSVCGSETIAPDAADQVIQLRESIRALTELASQLEVSGKDSGVSKFSWLDVPAHQKWKVTWGVFGRTILINLGLTVAAMLLLIALGVMATAGN